MSESDTAELRADVEKLAMTLSARLMSLDRERLLERLDRLRTDASDREHDAVREAHQMLSGQTTILRELHLLFIVLTVCSMALSLHDYVVIAIVTFQAVLFLGLSISGMKIRLARRAALLKSQDFWKKRATEAESLYKSMLFKNYAKGAECNQSNPATH